MDLWCNETSSSPSQSAEKGSPNETQPDGIIGLIDHNMLSDERVLEKLLLTEHRCLPSDPEHIYGKVQHEVLPHMRKTLTTWMLEVCEELRCEAIFPLAVNYVDRFLSAISVSKSQLQLLGAVCLLIASKLRQCHSIHPQDLVYFSDYSFTTTDIREWEMLLLTTLKWDVSAVVSTDFIEHLMIRLPLLCDVETILSSDGSADMIIGHVKRLSTDLCLLSCREIEFVNESPSVLATASLVTAIRSVLQHQLQGDLCHDLVNKVQEVTSIQAIHVEQCIHKIGQMTVVGMENAAKQASVTHNMIPVTNNKQQVMHKTVICNSVYPLSTAAPETPTDVQDVHF